MSEVLEFAARLSQVVGARPAGTEEEQQASFFIEEAMNEAGLDTSVEEFNCNPNYEMPRIVCCIVSIIFAVLALILPMMVIPAFVVCAIMAVFYILEMLGFSPLTKLSKRGISQNVIAKYYPGMWVDSSEGYLGEDYPEYAKIDGKGGRENRTRRGSSASRPRRKRKIIILARYDSGRVRRELKPPFIGILNKIRIAEMVGMALVALALLLRIITQTIDEGHIVLDIIMLIGVICSLLPVIAYIVHQTAAYSEGANNNASGVAVMIELAKRLAASAKPNLASKVIPDANGFSFAYSAEEVETGEIAPASEMQSLLKHPVMHGKDAIKEAGILPDGTDLVYDEASGGGSNGGRTKIEELNSADVPTSVLDDATQGAQTAFDEGKKEGSPEGKPSNNSGQNALSIEAQMQSASIEFAKYDEQDNSESTSQNIEEKDNNPWARLLKKSSEKKALDARGVSSSSPSLDSKAQLSAYQTINAAEASVASNSSNVPDWFKKGKAAANANKQGEEKATPNIQRSRLSDALDAAHEVSAQAIENFEGKGQDNVQTGSGIDPARLEEIHKNIMGTTDEASVKNDSQEKADEESSAGSSSTPQPQEAEETSDKAAVADRTISFIPVAADISEEMLTNSASQTSSNEAVSKTAEEILEDAASLTGSIEKVSADDKPAKPGRRSISLPSLTLSRDKKTGVQNAPLAEDASRAKGEARTALKNVGGETEYGSTSKSKNAERNDAKEGVSQSREGATTNFLKENAEVDAKAALSSLDNISAELSKRRNSSQKSSASALSQAKQNAKNIIPSLDVNPTDAPETPISVSAAGSFVQPSQTSHFQPVGDELIANMDSEEIFIEDVDDSDYIENVTRTGVIAGPGYVEMPKSRMQRFKSFFGKKKARDEEDSISFSDAVGIEEDFNAREVGKARGSWESFRDDSEDFFKKTDSNDLNSSAFDDSDWNGGAFSLGRERGTSSKSSNQERTTQSSSNSLRRSRNQSTSGGRRRSADEVLAQEAMAENDEEELMAQDMLDERDQIRNFRSSSAQLTTFEEVAAFARSFAKNAEDDSEIDGVQKASKEEVSSLGFQTEVWFVALGAELANNAGIKQFLVDHGDELRGSIVIDIDALGAGDLSVIDEEGIIKRVKSSTRMRRYASKAAKALGMQLGSGKMLWHESASYYTTKRGLLTMHLCGIDGEKPAYAGETDDTFDNLSEQKMLENTAFLLELLNTI